MEAYHAHAVLSVKRSREETTDPVLETPKRRRTLPPGRRHVKYQRYAKPPYTYLGMMVVAIQSTPDKRLTLAGIQDALADMFPFFTGEYQGWRDSIRHNLSHNPCFVKTNRKQNSTGCFWTVDLSLVPADPFKRGRVSKDLERRWAPTLTQQLQIPDIQLPPPRTPPKKFWPGVPKQSRRTSSATTQDGSDHFQTTSPSLSYTEAQYTRYLREEMAGNAVPLSQFPAFASLLYDTTTSDFTSAAGNLHRLCPPAEYGTPTAAERVQDSEHYFRHPFLRYDSPDTYSSYHVKSEAVDQCTHRVQDTPSPCIAPTNEDPFQRYFSDISKDVVPDSLLHLSADSDQTPTNQHQISSNLNQTSDLHQRSSDQQQRTSLLYQPTCEAVSPVHATHHDTLPGTVTVFPPAPTSDCSTITYISESSQMSSVSCVSTLSRDSTLLPFSDFSTVSFDDIKSESSL